jgi:hypothetical protein
MCKTAGCKGSKLPWRRAAGNAGRSSWDSDDAAELCESTAAVLATRANAASILSDLSTEVHTRESRAAYAALPKASSQHFSSSVKLGWSPMMKAKLST